MSHSSWFLYAATMRIYKHYDFNVKDAKTAAKRLSFSSYPGDGFLVSTIAIGNRTIAIGNSTIAIGNSTIAIGNSTIAFVFWSLRALQLLLVVSYYLLLNIYR